MSRLNHTYPVSLPENRTKVNSGLSPSASLQMELVQKTMSEWRNQDGGYSEEDNAGKQRVKRGEEFSPVAMQYVHRTHSRENH